MGQSWPQAAQKSASMVEQLWGDAPLVANGALPRTSIHQTRQNFWMDFDIHLNPVLVRCKQLVGVIMREAKKDLLKGFSIMICTLSIVALYHKLGVDLIADLAYQHDYRWIYYRLMPLVMAAILLGGFFLGWKIILRDDE